MKSVEPIDVVVGATSHQWDVSVTLSDQGQEETTLVATKTHCNGGVWTSTLSVLPKFIFTKMGEPETVRILDPGPSEELGLPLVFSTGENVWATQLPDGVSLENNLCTDFHPGIELLQETECDCNNNGNRDRCDIAIGLAEDCDGNFVPDECQADVDCNANGIIDTCELQSNDCNGNGKPDDCDLAEGTSEDCNANQLPDECDVAQGGSSDKDINGIPDECNEPPGCDPGGPYAITCTGLPVVVALDGGGSVDPEGEALYFEWTSDCPASIDDPREPSTVLSIDVSEPLECEVLLTVTDVLGSSDVCATTVGVQDLEAPQVACPEDIEVDCAGGSTVDFTVTATDSCDPDPHVVCVPSSGTLFPEGTTEVECSVTDASGNTGSCSFRVTVKCAGMQRPADCDQNGEIELTDGVCVLGFLFRGHPEALPCGDGTRTHSANVALLNLDGNAGIELTDAIRIFQYLFAGGPPHPLCTNPQCSECVEIYGCPDNDRC